MIISRDLGMQQAKVDALQKNLLFIYFKRKYKYTCIKSRINVLNIFEV